MRDYVNSVRLALDFAKMVYNTHVYGNTSLFVNWLAIFDWGYDKDRNGIMENEGVFGPMVTDGKLGLKKFGYALSQYTKYIRPGAKRIDAGISGASSVIVTAYKHNNIGKLTIVIINKSTSSHSANVHIKNIQGLSRLDIIRTSAAQNSANLGQVSVIEYSFCYDLPGESIATSTGDFNTKTKKIKVRR